MSRRHTLHLITFLILLFAETRLSVGMTESAILSRSLDYTVELSDINFPRPNKYVPSLLLIRSFKWKAVLQV